MSNINRPLSCPTYTGKEPYIFISYAHSDGERVYPEIKALHDLGYRIWYDEGITPGNEWSEEIAQAITGSTMFIVFISRNAIQSRNVKREIDYALDENKHFLAVHLEEVFLPPGWKLSIGNIQAILKWSIAEDDYLRKMMNVLPGNCQGDTDKNTNQVPDDFVFIKGGTFLMGGPEGEAGRRDNEAQHQVKVSDFYMAKYPVTVAQFETFIRESNYNTDADKDGYSYIWNGKWDKKLGVNWNRDTKGELQNDKQHPVIHVSWNDSMEYCKWLSEKLNTTFRLPTEAEWEYACRAGTTTPFYTGENLTTDQANYNGHYSYQNYPKGRYIGNTTPVGNYPPNDWGFYDMHGNVWEWCLDWYGDKYYNECKQYGIVENPLGPATGSYSVLRGGSWFNDAGYCRSAFRYYFHPASRYVNFGFRLMFLP
jgi:formylglycine-generating enzyme required for sulfatase activity